MIAAIGFFIGKAGMPELTLRSFLAVAGFEETANSRRLLLSLHLYIFLRLFLLLLPFSRKFSLLHVIGNLLLCVISVADADHSWFFMEESTSIS